MRGLTIFILVFLVACASEEISTSTTQATTTSHGEVTQMKLSSVFKNNEMIPEKYTCQGENINPPLTIEDVPDGTHTLILLIDDPDAPSGTWDHWILFNIPPTNEIPENIVPPGSLQGLNSWKKNEYGGPCPPSGTHRYFFKLFAIDKMLVLPRESTKNDVMNAMSGHILAQTELIGLYKK